MRNESDLKKYVEEEDRLKGNIRSSKIHLDGKQLATGKNLRRIMKKNITGKILCRNKDDGLKICSKIE